MQDFYYRLVSFGGLFVMLFIAWLLSENRKAISGRIVLCGLGLQLILALLFLRSPFGESIFSAVESVFDRLLQFSDAAPSTVAFATFRPLCLARSPPTGAWARRLRSRQCRSLSSWPRWRQYSTTCGLSRQS